MKLYHHPMSAGSRLVRLALAEYGVKAEHVLERAWERREDFLHLNPEGGVPVLVAEENAPLCGAIPICEYLNETHGLTLEDQRLMPDHPLARAEVRRLMGWFLIKFENEVTHYLVEEKVTKREKPWRHGGGPPDTGALRAARANLRSHLAYLAFLAHERNWLGGAGLSYADFAAAAALSVADYLGEMPWEDYIAAKNWYARLKSRPAFQCILADKLRGLTPPAHYTDLDF